MKQISEHGDKKARKHVVGDNCKKRKVKGRAIMLIQKITWPSHGFPPIYYKLINPQEKLFIAR
jgi:hypothetical protein